MEYMRRIQPLRRQREIQRYCDHRSGVHLGHAKLAGWDADARIAIPIRGNFQGLLN